MLVSSSGFCESQCTESHTSLNSICEILPVLSVFSCLFIFIKFSRVRCLQNNSDFHENWCSEIHSLVKVMNEFLVIHATFIA